jgi:hypothetical protein
MNVELGTDLETWAEQARKDAGLQTREEARATSIGGIIETGLGAAGEAIASFFKYKTAELHVGQPTPAGQTAYVPSLPAPKKDNTRTMLIVGGTALAAVVAFAAMR